MVCEVQHTLLSWLCVSGFLALDVFEVNFLMLGNVSNALVLSDAMYFLETPIWGTARISDM